MVTNVHIYQDNQAILEYLNSSRLFTNLPKSLLEQLVPLSQMSKYPKDSIILQEGEHNDKVFFLLRGVVAVYASEKLILHLRRSGDIFGEMSIISNRPCMAAVKSESECDVFSIKARDIGNYTDIDRDTLTNTLYRLFSMILTEKLSLTTHKAKQFEEANLQLEQEIKERRKAENDLQLYKDHLESEVERRVAELKLVNEKLQQEILEHRKADELLRSSLQEKEVLIQEIHHRVKNNLQVITSLLRLQSRQMNDQEQSSLFRDIEDRIQAMSFIHEELYQSKDLSHINTLGFIKRLASNLYISFSIDFEQVRLELDVDETNLKVDDAISCGLILNELISNALKYAFPLNRKGFLRVSLKVQDTGQIRIQVMDNGVGLADNFSIQNANSMGLRLVSLMIKELRGQLTWKNQPGATFDIVFQVKT